jgi:outer membrane protein with beta-barrel domain
MSKLPFILSLIAALVLGLFTPASAQPPAGTPAQAGSHATGTSLNPTWETSAGYQVLHVPHQTFPFGLNVDGAANFGPTGLVAELGWAVHKSDDVTTNVFNLGAGPRWTARTQAKAWPFVQVIAGMAHARVSVDTAGIEVTSSGTHFMLQPGAGAVFLAGDGWGIVGQVDYRRVFLDKDKTGKSGENDVRVLVGVRFILD